MSNELKIGITVLIAILVAFVGFRIMKDIPLFKTSTTVYTSFDRVHGLTSGNPVNVKGFKIGSVKTMQLMPNDSTYVTLSIDEEYQIPKGSIALLRSSGVLGNKFIEIIKTDSPEMVGDGGRIEGFFEEGVMENFADEGTKLSDNISTSIEGFDALMSNLNDALSEENKQSITEMLNNLEHSTGSLNNLIQDRKNDLDTMIKDAKSTLHALEGISSENKENLSTMISNLEATSAELETLSTGLNESNLTLNEVLNKINNSEGSLGKLINDPSLYNNFDSLSVNLNELVKNINKDPGKYLKHMRLIEVF